MLLLLIMYIYIYIHTRTCVKHCGGKLSSSHFRTLQWKHDSKCRHCCGVMLLLLIMYIYIYTQEPVWNIVGESCLSPTSERYSENMTQSVDTVVVWCFFYLLCIYIYIHTRTCVKHCGGKLSISHFRTLQWKHDSKCRHCCGVMLLLLIMYIYIYTQEPVWNIVGESCLSPTSERYSENMTQSVDTVVVWCFFYLLCIYIYTHKNLCETLWGKAVYLPLPNVTVKTWLKV